MRILGVTNCYPPHYIGGYELGCQRVMEELKQRGHDFAILTSTYGLVGSAKEEYVYRRLNLNTATSKGGKKDTVWRSGRIELRDRRTLTSLIDRIQPNAVLVWNMGGLSNSLVDALRTCRVPVTYAVSDCWFMERRSAWNRNYWLDYWSWPTRGFWTRWPKAVLRRFLSPWLATEPAAVNWGRAFFTSQRLRELHARAGLPVEDSPVIYWGVPLEHFRRDCGRSLSADTPPRLLFAGRLYEEKGPHTLLEALYHLSSPYSTPVPVSIAGEGGNPKYLQRLHDLAGALNGSFTVRFLGKVPASTMPEVYHAHDVLVFPSIWEEPFSLVILEAMAAGLCIVGTTAGGTAEILKDGVNSLTFEPSNPCALAARLQLVLADPFLRQRLAASGQRAVGDHFSLRLMVDRIETFLGSATSTC